MTPKFGINSPQTVKHISQKAFFKHALAEFFRNKGMVVDMNLHSPDHENPNPHCHLMLTMRPFQKDGTFLEKKCWREYDLDKNGQKIPTKKGNDYKSHKVYATDWDDRGNVEKWRALWADI